MLRGNLCELPGVDDYGGLRVALSGCFRKRRVLITGATGFIGRHVVAAGLALDAEIHALSLGGDIPGAKSWPVRIEDRRAVSEIVSSFQPEAVLHLAAAGSRKPFRVPNSRE